MLAQLSSYARWQYLVAMLSGTVSGEVPLLQLACLWLLTIHRAVSFLGLQCIVRPQCRFNSLPVLGGNARRQCLVACLMAVLVDNDGDAQQHGDWFGIPCTSGGIHASWEIAVLGAS